MFIRTAAIDGFDFEGLWIRDYTVGLDVQSSFAGIVAPPGSRHRPAHSRRSDKLYYVLEGTVSFKIGGGTATLSAGDLAIVPRGTVFSYKAHEERARLLLVHTPPFAAEDEVFQGE